MSSCGAGLVGERRVAAFTLARATINAACAWQGGGMSDVISVQKNADTGRFEGFLDGELVGIADYRESGDVVDMPHTVVPEQFAGRGFAGQIVKFALDDIRAGGKKVQPTCPYVDSWISKHPEYEDLRAS